MSVENLDDGVRLETAWNDALDTSVSYVRALLSSSGSSAWKLVSPTAPSTPPSPVRSTFNASSTARSSSLGKITAGDVVVHRRNGKAGEVFRAVVEVDCGSDINVDTFRGSLATPETRPLWDRMVEEAQLLDLRDTHTRITKTNYRLGWPSSPRDAVTISKTLVDQHTLIDVSTSLPRSRHEPVYLRPAPPYVRAHVNILAWCIQLPSSRAVEPPLPVGKARITCFWSWNPKGTWAVGGAVPQHLPTVMVGLVDYIRDGSEKVPVLLNFGQDVSVSAVSYDPGRVTLSANYAIVKTDDVNDGTRRQIEFGLSSTQGWDVQIHVIPQHDEESPSTSWSSFVGQSPPTIPGSAAPKRLVLRFVHSQLQPNEDLVRVKISIEQTSISNTTNGRVRINGHPVQVQQMNPEPWRNLLEGSPGTSAMSIPTVDTADSSLAGSREGSMVVKAKKGRSAVAVRSISSLIKRNYIYFTSLLQEPEPKWRPVAESKGVSVHQLDSIDPTLVVFRAEAVFVGVGVWDLFATIITPGTRHVWDKSYEDATLLEDVNELTDVWHFKSKASWPVSARDSVLVRSTYKSPSSVHIFGFSTENSELFPCIPPCVDPNVIRTQIDLQGWSIEALSPNTTQVTLLEQSHPGGWSNKSSIPQVMMSTLSGMGEFAIKEGAPPVATRLGGAKAISSRYDVEKETFQFKYEAAESRRSNSSSTATVFPHHRPRHGHSKLREDDEETISDRSSGSECLSGTIECGIRVDPDKWSNSIVVVVDPPPKNISALKRHRLSPNGGGLWLTIEHDLGTLGREPVAVTVRRGPNAHAAGSKTVISVNGAKIKVDSEDLSQTDVQHLKKQKRSKPSRVALDQPPALGAVRKRQSNLSLRSTATNGIDPYATITQASVFKNMYMPLSRLYSTAAESTRAALVPLGAGSAVPVAGSTPVDAAVRALGQLSRIHADRDGESTDPFGWQPVTDRDGLKVEKRIVTHVSDSFPIFRAGRIIEGFTAEEVSACVSSMRKDEYFEKPVRLQAYGHGITTSHVTAHTAFPFRDRSALIATVVGRIPDAPPPSPSVVSHAPLSTIFHASSSGFDPATLGMDASKYNPSTMPPCNVLLEGWILETIDPYSHEQYAIPSTRCMYVGAVDYGGNIPVSVNNMLNSGLPRALLNVENSLKVQGPPSRSRWPPMQVMAPDPTAQGPWSLEGTEPYKVPVDQVNNGEDFIMTVTVQPPSSSSKDTESLRPSLNHNDSRASSNSINSTRSQMFELAEDIRRGRRDLIVADIDVGAEFIKGGCEIAIRAVSLPEAYHGDGGDANILPLDFSGDKMRMPFKCSVISLAPSLLQAASLDPTSSTRHLLRFSLPTSGYEAPVNDPLSGKSAPLPRPRWLLDLINDGAVVQIRLVPRRQEPAMYMFEGAEVQVEDERKLPTRQLSLTKEPSKLKPPQLVPRTTPKAISLEKPLAVAREFLPDASVVKLDEPDNDSDINSEVTKTPTAEPVDLAAETASQPPLEPKHPTPPTPIERFNNLWRPLTRFTASAPVSKENSPVKLPATLPDTRSAAVSRKPSGASEPATPTAVTATAAAGATSRPGLAHTTVPLPAVIIVCIICLLVGSLLRSLLVEADFVIYSSPGTAPPEGETWRELKRLGEWRIGRDRDLVVAFARRRAVL